MKIPIEQIKERCKGDLLFFGKMITPSMFSEKSPRFHKELARELLNDKNQKLNIIAPRGHAKSSVAAGLLPLHHIFTSSRPTFVVLVSKTLGHAQGLLETIKDVLDHSSSFRSLYGYWGQHSAKSWTQSEVILRDGTKVLCRGATQQMRGLKHINQRPTLVVYDDPQDENNTKTKDSMEATFESLLKQVIPGLSAGKNPGRCIVIGTPIHQLGIVNRLEGMKSWKTLRYKAINTDESGNEWALWPQIKTLKQLRDLKEEYASIGKISTFYSEYQCEIIGDTDQLFKPADFQYWDGHYDDGILHITNLNGVSVSKKLKVFVFAGVDPASSTARTADFSVIFFVAVDSDKNIYCLDIYRKRERPMKVADKVVSMFKTYRHNFQKMEIETVGYQEMLRDYLKSQDIYIPGLGRKNNPRGDKSARLEGREPLFKKRKVFIKMKVMEPFEKELMMFPRGKNDDTLDGFFYATKNIWYPETSSVEVAKKSTERITQDWMLM